MESLSPETQPIDFFVDFLYEGLTGYAYLAIKDRNHADPKHWQTEFFHYPTEGSKLKKIIERLGGQYEVYLSPALYSEQHCDKSTVAASNVVWTEFDGNAPDWNDSNRPSLIIRSSSNKNQHVYWRLQEPITDVEVLEDTNRRITYTLGADASAWDATQVLRPPDTYNHKRDTSVDLLQFNDTSYDLAMFSEYTAPKNEAPEEWGLSELPDANEVLLKYSFGPDVITLLGKTKEEVPDRSSSLMQLAYATAQLGLTNNEIMVLLLMVDNKWEKFKGRKDQLKRLAHIITVARNKYPDPEPDDDLPFALAFGFETFLNTDIEINWLIEPMLMEQGSMLMVGPSGVGKTQITIQFLIHLALGKDYLHYKIEEPKKILFLSLEMGHGELKVFLSAMRGDLSDADVALLESNLIIIPHGEPWALNELEGQKQLINLIEEYGPQVVAVDSIGSAIQGNISADENVQPFTKFNDMIRKRYALTTWFIHHMRKAKEGPSTQDDVYGNQYLLNRSTSTYAVMFAKEDRIRMRNFKNRLAAKENDHIIERTENLNFISATESVNELLSNYIKPDSDENPTAANGAPL